MAARCRSRGARRRARVCRRRRRAGRRVPRARRVLARLEGLARPLPSHAGQHGLAPGRAPGAASDAARSNPRAWAAAAPSPALVNIGSALTPSFASRMHLLLRVVPREVPVPTRWRCQRGGADPRPLSRPASTARLPRGSPVVLVRGGRRAQGARSRGGAGQLGAGGRAGCGDESLHVLHDGDPPARRRWRSPASPPGPTRWPRRPPWSPRRITQLGARPRGRRTRCPSPPVRSASVIPSTGCPAAVLDVLSSWRSRGGSSVRWPRTRGARTPPAWRASWCAATAPTRSGSSSSATTSSTSSQHARAFVGYRIENGVLLVSGDPVGPPRRSRGSPASCAPSPRCAASRSAWSGPASTQLPQWERGSRALHRRRGDRRTDAFSLEGRAIRKVRQSVTRSARRRLTASSRAGRSTRRTLAELERCRSAGATARRNAASRWRWTRCAATTGGKRGRGGARTGRRDLRLPALRARLRARRDVAVGRCAATATR